MLILKRFLLGLIPIKIVNHVITKILFSDRLAYSFIKGGNPRLLEILSEKKLIHEFEQVKYRVPLYRKFSEGKKELLHIWCKEDFVKNVPVTEKGFFQSAKTKSELIMDGNIGWVGMLYTSSGYTGNPMIWALGRAEKEYARREVTIGMKIIFNAPADKTLVINGFSLGSWVSGMCFSKYLEEKTPVLNVGPSSEEILRAIQHTHQDFDQIIIGCYPPFVKNMLEEWNSDRREYPKDKIRFILGGEGFSEEFRDYIYYLLGEEYNPKNKPKIISEYGAADIGVTGIHENNDTTQIRRAARDHEELNKDIFGTKEINPMIFQYNPLNYFIETNESGEIILTSLNFDKIEPIVRYNIHDKGGIISHNDMMKILKKHGVKNKPKLPFPFIYIIGRSGGEVSINSAKIHPETIKGALYNKEIAKKITGDFHLRVEKDKDFNQSLNIDVQLKKSVKRDKTLKKKIGDMIYSALTKHNVEYKDMVKHYGNKAHPNVNILNFSEFKDKGIKYHYIQK